MPDQSFLEWFIDRPRYSTIPGLVGAICGMARVHRAIITSGGLIEVGELSATILTGLTVALIALMVAVPIAVVMYRRR